MSRFSAPDRLTLLPIVFLTLAACEPVGGPAREPASLGTPDDTQVPNLPPQDSVPASSSPPLAVAEKAEIYAFAAGIDSAQLVEAIDDARRETNPGRRALLLTALTERLAEIDPHRALDAATTFQNDLGLNLLGPLFARVAEDDPESAIAALARLKNQREIDVVNPIAMLVLDEIRDDSRLLDAWLAAVPETQSQLEEMRRRQYFPDLRAQGFLALTQADPDLVMDRIVIMSDRELRSFGIYQVADILARDNARGALARIENVQDERLRASMRYQVLHSWAAIEPMTALSYLSSLASWGDVPNVAHDESIRSVARNAMSAGVDPLQILAFSRTMPIDRAVHVRNAAMQALAQSNPVAAAAHIDEVSGNWRIGVVATLASGYVDIDPIAAFQWAQQQTPDIEQAVLTAIVRKDAGMGLDLALNGGVRSRDNALTAVVVQTVRLHPEQAPQLATRLNQSLSGSGLLDNAISSLAGEWIQRDRGAAMAWLAAPGVELPDSAYQAAARALANDPAGAAALTDRIPPGARPAWIEQVSGNYVRSDLEGAVAWIDQHRSDPDYALGAVAVVEQLVRLDSARAARLFAALPDTVDPQRATQTATMLASIWSQSDPVAAADWVSGLRDDTQRNQAMMNVTVNWSRRDPDAARSWILRQPAGPDRDRTLQAHLSVITQVGNGLPDARFFEEFSTDEVLSRAVTNVIGTRFMSDPAAGRRWLDDVDLSPAVRQRVEANLTLMEMMRARAPQSGNSLIFLPPAPRPDSPVPR